MARVPVGGPVGRGAGQDEDRYAGGDSVSYSVRLTEGSHHAGGTALTAGTACAVLYPAVAEAAHRAGADAVGLIDVGHSAGLTLHLDRVGITYGSGPVLGDPASPVQLSAVVRGDRPVPARAVPEVVARIGVGPGTGDDARSVRAQEIAGLGPVLAADPPLLLGGDAVALLPDAVARVPAGALPVVITAWALSSFPPEKRLRFLRRLGEVAAGRAVAWVSVEGVGVAPAVPTLGDRLASGHSIVGVAVFDGSACTVEAVGRCWSRGRWLSWLT